MDFTFLIVTLSLTIQLIVLALLVTAYWSQKTLKFRRHGITMLSAVTLHIIMIFGIMVPSFSVIAFTQTSISTLIVSLVMIHATFGAITALLGIYVVASWRLRTSLQYCQPKKKIMLTTFILWLISISLGIIIYVSLYLPSIA
jgi:uncharacterized membrane protein YozB (DUF420 family)